MVPRMGRVLFTISRSCPEALLGWPCPVQMQGVTAPQRPWPPPWAALPVTGSLGPYHGGGGGRTRLQSSRGPGRTQDCVGHSHTGWETWPGVFKILIADASEGRWAAFAALYPPSCLLLRPRACAARAKLVQVPARMPRVRAVRPCTPKPLHPAAGPGSWCQCRERRMSQCTFQRYHRRRQLVMCAYM